MQTIRARPVELNDVYHISGRAVPKQDPNTTIQQCKVCMGQQQLQGKVTKPVQGTQV